MTIVLCREPRASDQGSSGDVAAVAARFRLADESTLLDRGEAIALGHPRDASARDRHRRLAEVIHERAFLGGPDTGGSPPAPADAALVGAVEAAAGARRRAGRVRTGSTDDGALSVRSVMGSGSDRGPGRSSDPRACCLVATRGSDVGDVLALLVRRLDATGVGWEVWLRGRVDELVRPDAITVLAAAEASPLVVDATVLAVTANRSIGADASSSRRPRFARALASGVALAEEPGGGGDGRPRSFGQHRSALVADGLLVALADRDPRPHAAIAARFVAEGIDPRRPWVTTGSVLDRLWP